MYIIYTYTNGINIQKLDATRAIKKFGNDL